MNTLTCRVHREQGKRFVLTHAETGMPVKLTPAVYRRLYIVMASVAPTDYPLVLVDVQAHMEGIHKYYTMSIRRVS